MFTDLVGFTSDSHEDEPGALHLLDEQGAILGPILRAHRGREIKSMGDGLLLEFPNARDAVECAVALQQSLHDHNSTEGVRPLRLRAGIHLGDVEDRGNDILGDAVNIASRIEPLAEPGGVCLSAQVYDQVRHKLAYRMEPLGPKSLKGILEPVPIYRIVLPWTTGGPPPGVPSVPRIAVLPLTNISPDPKDEYLADGLTEEIIAVTSRIRGLRVVARTSTARYKSTSKTVAEIGAELGADAVLEGSLRKSGDRLRITVQLINPITDERHWSETFDRGLSDIFQIQSEIAERVATALRLALPSGSAAARPPTTSVEAYQRYLLARSLWNRRTGDSIATARRLFEEALQLDPGFARAYSGLADCYSILVDNRTVPPEEAHPAAQKATRKALELDDSLAEAHASLGILLEGDKRWDEAEREYRRSLDLDPTYAQARHWYFMLLRLERRDAEAEAQLERWREIDPISPRMLEHRGVLRWTQGRLAEAMADWEAADQQGHRPETLRLYRIVVLAQSSRPAEARGLLDRPRSPELGYPGHAYTAIAHAALGMREEARRDIDAMQDAARTSYVSPLEFAWAHGALNDGDPFFAWMEKCLRLPINPMYWVTVLPIFSEVRRDPRYGALRTAAGLRP